MKRILSKFIGRYQYPALGITGFLLETIFKKPGNSPIVPKIEIISLPFIKNIPVLGEIISSHHIFVYFSFILAFLLHIFFYKTSKGLHIRAIGEHPLFVLSLVVLAGFVGRAHPPASIGVPYEKEEG